MDSRSARADLAWAAQMLGDASHQYKQSHSSSSADAVQPDPTLPALFAQHAASLEEALDAGQHGDTSDARDAENLAICFQDGVALVLLVHAVVCQSNRSKAHAGKPDSVGENQHLAFVGPLTYPPPKRVRFNRNARMLPMRADNVGIALRLIQEELGIRSVASANPMEIVRCSVEGAASLRGVLFALRRSVAGDTCGSSLGLGTSNVAKVAPASTVLHSERLDAADDDRAVRRVPSDLLKARVKGFETFSEKHGQTRVSVKPPTEVAAPLSHEPPPANATAKLSITPSQPASVVAVKEKPAGEAQKRRNERELDVVRSPEVDSVSEAAHFKSERERATSPKVDHPHWSSIANDLKSEQPCKRGGEDRSAQVKAKADGQSVAGRPSPQGAPDTAITEFSPREKKTRRNSRRTSRASGEVSVHVGGPSFAERPSRAQDGSTNGDDGANRKRSESVNVVEGGRVSGLLDHVSKGRIVSDRSHRRTVSNATPSDQESVITAASGLEVEGLLASLGLMAAKSSEASPGEQPAKGLRAHARLRAGTFDKTSLPSSTYASSLSPGSEERVAKSPVGMRRNDADRDAALLLAGASATAASRSQETTSLLTAHRNRLAQSETGKRWLMLNELATTEESFQLQLTELVYVFQQPLSDQKKVCPKEDADKIFSNAETLLQFHSLLSQDLRSRIDDWLHQQHLEGFGKGNIDSHLNADEMEASEAKLLASLQETGGPQIGNIISKLAPFMKLAQEYIANYDNSIAHVMLLMKKRRKFASIVGEQVCTTKSVGDCAGVDYLKSLLIVPIQRYPRYAMLLREILKLTPEDHADVADVAKAADEVSRVLEWLNTRQGDDEKRKNRASKAKVRSKFHSHTLRSTFARRGAEDRIEISEAAIDDFDVDLS